MLYLQLAYDHPAVFTSLTRSMCNQFIRLADVGHQEEALAPIQEAGALHQQPANQHPTTFANSLDDLSHCLQDLGNEEAQAAKTEPAMLSQQLVDQ
jgi:hypothetical protein